jgi:hypothetical protein
MALLPVVLRLHIHVSHMEVLMNQADVLPKAQKILAS